MITYWEYYCGKLKELGVAINSTFTGYHYQYYTYMENSDFKLRNNNDPFNFDTIHVMDLRSI